MGLKTLSFLTLFLPSLYILLSSLSLPNLVKAEPTNNNNDSTYLTVSLSNKDANTIAKLDKYITNDNTIITDYPTILSIEANSSVGYLATVSTNKDHSNLTRERTNPSDQDNQVINPVQANYSEQEVVYSNYDFPIFTQTGGSSLADNTWGFLPISDCSFGRMGQAISCKVAFARGHDDVITSDSLKLARFYKVPTKDNPVTLKDAAAEIGKTKSQTFYIYYGAKLSNSLPAGTYSTNVVYTVTPKLPPIAPPTISKVINDTHYTTKSDLTAIEGTNLKTATSVFIDFNKDGKADSNELATNLKTYLGTDKEDTVISFNSPITNTPGEYDVYVTTMGGIAKLDQSYIVSKFTLCRSGDTNNSCIVDLDETMIPVKYTGNTTAPKWESLTNDQAGLNNRALSDDQIGQWYDYNNKQWANAVTVKDPNKYRDQNKVIDENDVLGYFVYIPRYSYEVMRPNATDQFVPDSDYKLPDNNLIKHPGFMINFENKYNLFKTPGDSTSCSSISGSTLTAKDYRTKCAKDLGYSRLNPENDSTKTNKTTWATHPAFRWQYTRAINGIDKTQDLNGFWVGKYETTGSTTAPTVKPNSKHIGAMPNGLARYYSIAKSLGRKDVYNSYGDNTATRQNSHNLSNHSSHMLKNTEWGAITYLSSSTYGAGLNKVKKNGSNSKDKDGNNEDSYGITGCGPQSETSANDYDGCNSYNTSLGQLASTTNNPTGIYDMVGGAEESVMANLTDSPNQTTNNDYPVTNPIKPPYVDLYKTTKAGGKFGAKPAWSTSISGAEYYYNNDVCAWATCGGQALHETKRVQSVDYGYGAPSWGANSSYFPKVDKRWSIRGSYYYGSKSSLFYLDSDSGSTWMASSFRTAISPSF